MNFWKKTDLFYIELFLTYRKQKKRSSKKIREGDLVTINAKLEIINKNDRRRKKTYIFKPLKPHTKGFSVTLNSGLLFKNELEAMDLISFDTMQKGTI